MTANTTMESKCDETNNLNLLPRIQAALQQSIDLKNLMLDKPYLELLATMGQKIANAITLGGKLLLCGNGGSAADAQHLAGELLVRLRPEINREALPAISLATDTTTITACANDYGFEYLYERMVKGLGRPGDVLLGLTTSGRSKNIIRALQAARELNILTLGFLGSGGGEALAHCDHAFIVPAKDPNRVQEVHITAGHILMDLVEHIMLRSGYLKNKG